LNKAQTTRLRALDSRILSFCAEVCVHLRFPTAVLALVCSINLLLCIPNVDASNIEFRVTLGQPPVPQKCHLVLQAINNRSGQPLQTAQISYEIRKATSPIALLSRTQYNEIKQNPEVAGKIQGTLEQLAKDTQRMADKITLVRGHTIGLSFLEALEESYQEIIFKTGIRTSESYILFRRRLEEVFTAGVNGTRIITEAAIPSLQLKLDYFEALLTELSLLHIRRIKTPFDPTQTQKQLIARLLGLHRELRTTLTLTTSIWLRAIDDPFTVIAPDGEIHQGRWDIVGQLRRSKQYMFFEIKGPYVARKIPPISEAATRYLRGEDDLQTMYENLFRHHSVLLNTTERDRQAIKYAIAQQYELPLGSHVVFVYPETPPSEVQQLHQQLGQFYTTQTTLELDIQRLDNQLARQLQ